MVGMSIDGIYGHAPDSSTNLMRTLVSVSAGVAAGAGDQACRDATGCGARGGDA